MTTNQKHESGICIPCNIQPTPDKGLGVFAGTDVPEGSTIWGHVPGQFEVLDENYLAGLLAECSDEDAVDLLTHITSIEEFPNFMVRYFDEGAYINHSEQPNVKRKYSANDYLGQQVISALDVSKVLCDRHFDLVAKCNIEVGDELLMDYNDEPDDPEYYENACERYGVTWEWL